MLFSISALLFFPSYVSLNNNGIIPSADAIPPVPAVLYGADSVSNLYSIDPSDGSYTPIGSGIGSVVTGIDFNSTGFLYGADGNVTTISTTTGVGAYAYSKSADCTGGFAFDPSIKPNPRFICGLVFSPLLVVNGLNPNGSFLSITSHLLDPSDTSSFGGLSVGPDNNIYYADTYGIYRIIQPVNSASFSLFAPLDFSAFPDTNCGVISLSFDTSGKLYGAVSCDTSQYLATINLSNGPSTTPIAVSKVAQSVPGLAAISFVHTIPSPPSSPIASTVNGTVSLTWTIPTSTGGSAILGYNVYRSTTPGGEGATPLATVTNAPGYTDNSGLVPGQTYYYTIKAFNISGLSPSSNEVYLIVSPVSPSKLTATPGNNQVSLSWTAPTSNGGSSITGYNIYRGTTAGGESATPIATGVTSTSFVDTGVTNGQTYYYVIKAVNSGGMSYASNEASATLYAAAPPSAPSALTATPGNNQVSLSWTAPTSNGGSAITGYNIYRGTTAGGESATPIATGVTSTSFVDTGVTNGQTYYYVIRAVNSAGASSASNEANATPSSPPSSPSALTAVPGDSQVSLSWTAPTSNGGSAITGYNIYRGTTAGGESATPIATGVTSTSFVDTGVTNGQTYYYVIRAVNSAGASSASNEANATPTASTSTPFAKKSGVVENLSMLTLVTKDDQHDIKEAANDITESVTPTWWSTDGIHLNTKKGEHVFDEEKEATRHMMDVIKDGKESTSVLNSLRNDINQLVDVDNMLATTAINDAKTLVTHLSGNDAKELQHHIDDAQKEMNNAATDYSKGNFDDVIEHYKHAWKDVTDNDDDVKHDDNKDHKK
jgi:predicted phage tail protein